MKLLLDTCVWGGAVKALRTAGHDVMWAGEWPDDPGDEEILAHAHREGRILITLDKDFGELTIVLGRPHVGIIRLVDHPAGRQSAVCLDILARHGQALLSGAIVTAEPGRLRVRPPSE